MNRAGRTEDQNSIKTASPACHTLQDRLEQCTTLPTLPGVALELLQQFREPEVDLKETAEIIQQDPALTATVLRFVNSAAFGVRREITSLTHAISLLGLNAIRTLALSFSLVRGLRRTDRDGFDYMRFWQRSLLSAIAARALGSVKGVRDREGLFLAGLLQDIGMLALQEVASDQYIELNRMAEVDHTKLYELEREHLGTDHAEAGAWLAKNWSLPDDYQALIWGSHHPDQVKVKEELLPALECVVLSGWLAEIWLDQSAALVSLKSRAWMRLMGGLEPKELESVANEVHQSLANISTLFEIRVDDYERADDLLIEARDQLAAISLENLHQNRQVELERENLASQNLELRERSYRDSLTDLYNRAYLDDCLIDQFLRTAALDKPTSVIFIDLNDFKAVNDTYGHAIGDRVLVAVAETIRQELRQGDQAIRFGGDEFVILLPETDHEDASRVGLRIEEAIRVTSIESESGERISVSASIGTATHNRTTRFHCLEALCHAADMALYEAKRLHKEQKQPHHEEDDQLQLRVVKPTD